MLILFILSIEQNWIFLHILKSNPIIACFKFWDENILEFSKPVILNVETG